MLNDNKLTFKKHQPVQLDFLNLLDAALVTVPNLDEFPINDPLIDKLHRQSGWSAARCRAAIEANGGRLYD